jgi:hypothetical protein
MLSFKGTIPMLCRYWAVTGKDVLTIRPGFFRAGNAGGILVGGGGFNARRSRNASEGPGICFGAGPQL